MLPINKNVVAVFINIFIDLLNVATPKNKHTQKNDEL